MNIDNMKRVIEIKCFLDDFNHSAAILPEFSPLIKEHNCYEDYIICMLDSDEIELIEKNIDIYIKEIYFNALNKKKLELEEELKGL